MKHLGNFTNGYIADVKAALDVTWRQGVPRTKRVEALKAIRAYVDSMIEALKQGDSLE